MCQTRNGTPYVLGATVTFPTTMRSAPSITTSSMGAEVSSGATEALTDGAVTVNSSVTVGGFYTTRTSGNWGSDSVAIFRANGTTSAYVEYSSEL
jgi:hypothetical protein